MVETTLSRCLNFFLLMSLLEEGRRWEVGLLTGSDLGLQYQRGRCGRKSSYGGCWVFGGLGLRF